MKEMIKLKDGREIEKELLLYGLDMLVEEARVEALIHILSMKSSFGLRIAIVLESLKSMIKTAPDKVTEEWLRTKVLEAIAPDGN